MSGQIWNDQNLEIINETKMWQKYNNNWNVKLIKKINSEHKLNHHRKRSLHM